MGVGLEGLEAQVKRQKGTMPVSPASKKSKRVLGLETATWV